MSDPNMNYVGRPVPRLDALDKVTGRAVYGADVELPGMLYGATCRSPLPHARMVDIDLTAARRVPGVRAAITGKDFPYTFGSLIQDQPFLAIDKVRYVGEPVAAIAAESEAAAQEALERIQVRYEELPSVFDPKEAAARGAPLIHETLEAYPRFNVDIIPGTNVATAYRYSLGDVEQGFTDSDELFEDEFYIHAVAHSPMETHAAVARYFPASGEHVLWSSTDRPYYMAKDFASSLGISLAKVRVISNYTGGGFGGKGALVAEAIAVALARFTDGRPVKVVFSREEELTASHTRHACFVKLKTGVKKDGSLVARRGEMTWDNGAYCALGPNVAKRGSLTIFGPYRMPHMELVSRLVYTNKEMSGAYRGFGTTQMTWACEVQMDVIAERLGIDPLELRIKNAYVEGDPYINGQILRSVGLKETLEKAGREIEWGRPKPHAQGPKARGIGVATTIKGTATPTDSACFIKLGPDGSTTILCSAPEVGSGQKTVLAQIAAETIGIPISWIDIPHPDTRITPYDYAVASSRTTYHMGNAIRAAGLKVRKKILEIAGEALKADPASLRMVEGRITDEDSSKAPRPKGRGFPVRCVAEIVPLDPGLKAGASGARSGKQIDVRAVLEKRFGRKGGEILEEGYYSPEDSLLLEALPGRKGMSSIFWMFATHAAEVEVDTETGVVKVIKIAAAHDVGRAINPLTCEQQIEGAAIMGLSNTLFEEFRTERGRILNDTLADYKLAGMLDVPEVVPIIVESPHEEGPFGAKGVGEPAAAPTAPAIANAIYDAVGVRIKDLPITPEKLLAAIKKKAGKLE